SSSSRDMPARSTASSCPIDLPTRLKLRAGSDRNALSGKQILVSLGLDSRVVDERSSVRLPGWEHAPTGPKNTGDETIHAPIRATKPTTSRPSRDRSAVTFQPCVGEFNETQPRFFRSSGSLLPTRL